MANGRIAKNKNFDSPGQTRVITTITYLYPQPMEFRNFLSLIGRNLVAGPELSLYMTGQIIHGTN